MLIPPDGRLPQLMQRLLNVPVALDPARAETLVLALAGIPDVPIPTARGADRGGYDMVRGVAVIPVKGILVNRLGSSAPCFGLTGYDGISAALAAALVDPGVRGIVFDIDSPGGEVAGCFDLSDEIFAVRGRKPMRAILNEQAFSAAYAIASAADKVIVPRTGGTGGIGIITLLMDVSAMLKGAGVRINVIQFGARKSDGLSVLPLAPDARRRVQHDVDKLGELFVATVARNRYPFVSRGAVRATQAATYLGDRGVHAGLADTVASPRAALAAFIEFLQRRPVRRVSAPNGQAGLRSSRSAPAPGRQRPAPRVFNFD